jgi:hypothetical protein
MIQVAIKVIMVRTVLRSAVAIVKTDIATMLTDTAHAWMGGKHHCVIKVILSFIIYFLLCDLCFCSLFKLRCVGFILHSGPVKTKDVG